MKYNIHIMDKTKKIILNFLNKTNIHLQNKMCPNCGIGFNLKNSMCSFFPLWLLLIETLLGNYNLLFFKLKLFILLQRPLYYTGTTLK